MLEKILKSYGPEWMGLVRYIPYPLRSAKLSLELRIFGFWMPSFTFRKYLTEDAKKQGDKIWWVRFAWFQISFSRWI